MTPFKLLGLDHIVLRVADAPAMIAFYCEVLGCHVDHQQPAIGLTHLRAGAALIDLITLDGALGKLGGAGPRVEGRNLDHLCLAVQAFDEAAIRAHLAAHGVAITDFGQRYGAQGDGASIYLQDPEGNTVELKGVG